MDFDPVLLRTFVAVTETGGFTRAAHRLHLTQSAVSHQIRRLEERIGRPLLHRTTRTLTLTEDGEEFLRHAERILRSLDSLNRRFRSSPMTGTVRFGVTESFMNEQLPSLLCRFSHAFPAVRLSVNVGIGLDFCAMIRNRDLDIAVVVALPDSIEGSVLHRTQLVWAAADSFDPPRDASLPLAFFPAPCIIRQAGIAALEKTATAWHVVFTTQSQQGLRAAVLSGLAATVLTRDRLEPGMRIVDGQYGLPPLPDASFTLIWNDDDKTPAICAFGRMVLEMPESLSGPDFPL